MKWVAIVLLILALVLGGVIAYQALNSSLVVAGQGAQRVPASDREGEFSVLRTAVERGSVEGTVFVSGGLGDIADYSYEVYTLRLKNNGLIDAEMVEVQLAPLAGDALYYGESGEVTIPKNGTRDIWVTVLTTGEKAARDVYVTYYLWGRPYRIKYTFNG